MVKNSLTYTAPDILETHIELESAICSGSVDITAQAPAQGIQAIDQTVNKDFGSDNDFSSQKSDAWD